eukprot:Nk52_evm1s289 gene=Nk52_evmTU1s289
MGNAYIEVEKKKTINYPRDFVWGVYTSNEGKIHKHVDFNTVLDDNRERAPWPSVDKMKVAVEEEDGEVFSPDNIVPVIRKPNEIRARDPHKPHMVLRVTDKQMQSCTVDVFYAQDGEYSVRVEMRDNTVGIAYSVWCIQFMCEGDGCTTVKISQRFVIHSEWFCFGWVHRAIVAKYTVAYSRRALRRLKKLCVKTVKTQDGKWGG